MKTRIAIVSLVLFLAMFVLQQAGMTTTINEVRLGQTASATPTAVGTSTPVPVLHCSSTLDTNNSVTKQTFYVHVCVTGGTLGTDGCYASWAPESSPCAAASPAPNASTQVGLFIPTGGSSWACQDINYPSALGGLSARVLNAEMDAVCTAASMKVSRVTLP